MIEGECGARLQLRYEANECGGVVWTCSIRARGEENAVLTQRSVSIGSSGQYSSEDMSSGDKTGNGNGQRAEVRVGCVIHYLGTENDRGIVFGVTDDVFQR